LQFVIKIIFVLNKSKIKDISLYLICLNNYKQ